MIPAALKTLRSSPLQPGQVVSGSSRKDCTTSRCSLQERHAYSYVGMGLLAGPRTGWDLPRRVLARRLALGNRTCDAPGPGTEPVRPDATGGLALDLDEC